MIRRARDMLAGLRERRARHRKRSVLYRVIFATAGFCVVTGGILLLVLPGPGLVVIAVGLGMLALEFSWAERGLEATVDRLEKGLERVRGRRARDVPPAQCQDSSEEAA